MKYFLFVFGLLIFPSGLGFSLGERNIERTVDNLIDTYNNYYFDKNGYMRFDQYLKVFIGDNIEDRLDNDFELMSLSEFYFREKIPPMLFVVCVKGATDTDFNFLTYANYISRQLPEDIIEKWHNDAIEKYEDYLDFCMERFKKNQDVKEVKRVQKIFEEEDLQDQEENEKKVKNEKE